MDAPTGHEDRDRLYAEVDRVEAELASRWGFVPKTPLGENAVFLCGFVPASKRTSGRSRLSARLGLRDEESMRHASARRRFSATLVREAGIETSDILEARQAAWLQAALRRLPEPPGGAGRCLARLPERVARAWVLLWLGAACFSALALSGALKNQAAPSAWFDLLIHPFWYLPWGLPLIALVASLLYELGERWFDRNALRLSRSSGERGFDRPGPFFGPVVVEGGILVAGVFCLPIAIASSRPLVSLVGQDWLWSLQHPHRGIWAILLYGLLCAVAYAAGSALILAVTRRWRDARRAEWRRRWPDLNRYENEA